MRSTHLSVRKVDRGIALLAVLGLTVLVLGLAGATLGLFSVRAKRARFSADLALTRHLANDSFQLSTEGLSALIALAPKQAPQTSFYFLGGDLNGDRILSRAGEIEMVKPVSSPPIFRRPLVDAGGDHIRLNGSRLYDEDVGEDGIPDELERLYDPIRRPDPSRDNYHPLFNPKGTEGNGIQEPEEIDVNGNNLFDREEDPSRRWRRTPGKITGLSQTELDVADGSWSMKASDVNNCIDLNGPEELTARLLNNLFRTLDLHESRMNRPDPRDEPGSFPEVLGENGRGFKSLDQLDLFLRSQSVRLRRANGTPVPIQRDDPDAVKIIKKRRDLPGGRFTSVNQLLEIAGPSQLSILNVPALQGYIDPNDPNDPSVEVLSDLDEYRRIRPFLTCDAVQRGAFRRKLGQIGNVTIEQRAPLPINTAPIELVTCAVLAAFEPEIFQIGGPGPETFKKAARYFARVLVNFRLGVRIFPGRPSGRDRATPGPILNAEDFQTFMVDFRSYLRTDPLNPRNIVILKNFDNIVIQFSENQVYQDQIPDRVQDAPIDKQSLRLSLSAPNLTFFPTGIFNVETESRIRIRDRAVDDRIFANREIVGVGGSRRPRRLMHDVADDRFRRRYSAIIKVADILHHTTQEDFEGRDGKQGIHVNTRSYPERLSDDDSLLKIRPLYEWKAPGGQNITSIVYDKERGIAYFLTDQSKTLYTLHYGRFNPQAPPHELPQTLLDRVLRPRPVPIATSDPLIRNDPAYPEYRDLPEMPTDYVPSLPNFLEIDPRSVFGDQGRLYLGRRTRNKIHVFDLIATVPEGTPVRAVPRPTIDLEGPPITDHPNYSAAAGGVSVGGLVPYPGGRGFFLVVSRQNSSVIRFMYPRIDNRAKPEDDDPNTPVDERVDGIDNDLDGRIDDRPGSPWGTPEGNVWDLIDNDGDGVADDGADRGLTSPLPLFPPVRSRLAALPVDWAYDSLLDQFIVCSATRIQRIRSTGTDVGPLGTSSGMEVDAAHLRNVAGRLVAGESITHVAVDPGNSVFLLTRNATNNISRLLKFSIQRLAFLDEAILVNVSPAQSLTVDPVNDLVLVSGNNKIVPIRIRGSLMEVLEPITRVGSQLTLLPDPSRNWLIAGARRVQGGNGRIKLYSYPSWPLLQGLVKCYQDPNDPSDPNDPNALPKLVQFKHLNKGGQIKLAQVSSQDTPTGPRQFLAKADLDHDIHLRRPDQSVVDFGNPDDTTDRPTGTRRIRGQIIRFKGQERITINRPSRSVFPTVDPCLLQDPNELRPRLNCDGFFAITNTRNRANRVLELLRYDTNELYGDGDISGEQPNRGLRVGGVGFWVKFDGFGINEGGAVAIDPADPPKTIDLFRMFHKVRIYPRVFISRDDTMTEEEELGRLLGVPPDEIKPGTIRFRRKPYDYYVETRISLVDFQDINGNGDIDTVRVRCINHMDIAADMIGVSYEVNSPDPVQIVVDTTFDPISQNADVSYNRNQEENLIGFRQSPPKRINLSEGGEWIHFLNLWGTGVDPATGQEKVHNRFYINGKVLKHDGADVPFDAAAIPERNLSDNRDNDRDRKDLNGDGMIVGPLEGIDDDASSPFGRPELDGLRRNLRDDDGDGHVDDGYVLGNRSFCALGLVTDEPRPPKFVMKAIFDDLVFYRSERSFTEPGSMDPRPKLTFEPRRFQSRGETLDTDPDAFATEGEPFNDLNGNGKFDGTANIYGGYVGKRRAYFDRNGNGIHDKGEPYQGMYPFDFGEQIPGEPYFDFDRSGTFSGTNADQSLGREFGENRPDPTADSYQDQNGNGTFDGGESYIDLRTADQGWTPPDDFRDQNFNGSLDGSGKFARSFDHTLSPGDQIAWIAYDGVTPEGTALVPELVVYSLNGEKLNHFYGDRATRRSRLVLIRVKEPARLQYRINFMMSRNQGIYEPFRAGDGVAATVASGNDTQRVPFGARVKNGRRIIGPGPDAGDPLREPLIDTAPAGGDRFVLPYQSPVLESVTVAVITAPQILDFKEFVPKSKPPRVVVKRQP